MRHRPALLLLLFGALSASAQAPGKAAPVDAKAVDAAVDRAGQYLLEKIRKKKTTVWQWENKTSIPTMGQEFVLYTLLYTGIPKNDPDYQKALGDVLERDHTNVYRSAVRAMLLTELDREKYLPQIAQCARFLVDAQCANGQWDYGGEKLEVAAAAPDAAPPAPGPAQGGAGKAKPEPAVAVKRTKKGPPAGNNSTSQVALLGLRACLLAGVKVPRETLALAEQWWRKDQNADGGWGYSQNGEKSGSYGSMTAGGLGSLAICAFYQGRDPKTDPAVQKGAKWFGIKGDHWTFKNNPLATDWHYYWFYALERAGILIDTERFGAHEWHVEGSEWLLKRQNQDGSWNKSDFVEDTCYAVLFLRRATRPLTKVYSPR